MNVKNYQSKLLQIDIDSIPADRDEKRQWIKYQLKIRKLSFAFLAKKNNISRQAFTLAMNKPYPSVEYIIAQALRLEPSSIWPERYKNGIPVKVKNEE